MVNFTAVEPPFNVNRFSNANHSDVFSWMVTESRGKTQTFPTFDFKDHPTPDTWAEKFEVFERITSIRKTKENFDSCNSRKRMEPAVYLTYMSPNFRLFLASNLSVQKIRIFLLEFIRSKFSIFSAHVSCDSLRTAGRLAVRCSARSGGQMSRHNVRPGEWGGQQRAVNRASSRCGLEPPSAWAGRELFTGESSLGFCEWFKVQ